ncbi:hypothetical protein [Deinococcus ficus]|uniref:hypothetical protein n=1 Tax=Deinococcus ficus TaxID=317577 RepID=UPI00174B2433|nr:hypothetical protein [Deinococcus ficus]GHF87222.1 hypothetical protein GCM10017782_25630 [Deinococcus ficus]
MQIGWNRNWGTLSDIPPTLRYAERSWVATLAERGDRVVNTSLDLPGVAGTVLTVCGVRFKTKAEFERFNKMTPDERGALISSALSTLDGDA